MTATTQRKKSPTPVAPQDDGVVRVAIYARISVADRDASAFSSIEAQVEAIEAHVKARRADGWVLAREPYVDDGFSGGTAARPALQRLMEDASTGLFDVVVVHRFDRFSRSQRDFLNLLHELEEHGVAFASVNQPLDTSSPMGRCMLHLLASFGQLEREVIAERTRDKIRAARKRGLWTGGRPVLGYDIEDKRLVINEPEAEQVRRVFNLYANHGSLLGVVEELNDQGWTSKAWTNRSGNLVGGQPFTKDTVRAIIVNPLYMGKVRCGDDLSDGVHDAIIDEDTWHAVQHQLAENAKGRGPSQRRPKSGLLSGLVRCGVCGSSMTTSRTKKANRRYSYLVCARVMKEGAAACPGSRVATGKLEAFVLDRIRELGRDASVLRATVDADRASRDALRPSLQSRLHELQVELGQLESERKNLLDAVGGGGTGAAAVMRRLGETEAALEGLRSRCDDVRTELRALDGPSLDLDELQAALHDLDSVWAELYPTEQARVLALLLEEVRFDAPGGEVELLFRPDGPQSLWAQAKRSTA